MLFTLKNERNTYVSEVERRMKASMVERPPFITAGPIWELSRNPAVACVKFLVGNSKKNCTLLGTLCW